MSQGLSAAASSNSLPPLLFALALLIPAAILVYWLGQNYFRQQISSRKLEPKGRAWGGEGLGMKKSFRTMVDRYLQRQSPTMIAQAQAGPVMFRGQLCSADQTLGGRPGVECVWRNRQYARPEMAVASERIVMADDSGRVTLEHVDRAYVVSTAKALTPHNSSISLYLGDIVEVIGMFRPNSNGLMGDAQNKIYGTLGQDKQLYIRLCERKQHEISPTVGSEKSI